MSQLTKHGERGQIVMLMPLFLFLFMLGATLTVDMGRLLVARRDVQAAVDFAAADERSRPPTRCQAELRG